MRIFVSYARVDKPYCLQIVNMLSVHDVWYDQRMYAGQQWWKEILRRLDWCEGFVYLLSPESVASEYCRREYDLARKAGRHIFPVLINQEANLPSDIQARQYADFSKGLTVESVTMLLNSITQAEKERRPSGPVPREDMITEDYTIPVAYDDARLVGEAASAMAEGQYDRAVFLLRRGIESGYHSKFIDIHALLREAEAGLNAITRERERKRDYDQIVELMNHPVTRKFGWDAFLVFSKHHPDYDPKNLRQYADGAGGVIGTPSENGKPPVEIIPPAPPLPMLDWIRIPEGQVRVGGDSAGERHSIPSFQISKYPVTNHQYQVFLDDVKGYANPDWWNFSPAAAEWRTNNPKPKGSTFKGDERPTEMVSWFDALAFCKWLSARSGEKITLPTIAQRLRTIQEDDERLYPWGDEFDPARCNTREANIKMTTVVNRYPQGATRLGVFDLVGNVWEWCLNGRDEAGKDPEQATNDDKRIVHGGSFVSPYERSQATFLYFIMPATTFASIGFRIVKLD